MEPKWNPKATGTKADLVMRHISEVCKTDTHSLLTAVFVFLTKDSSLEENINVHQTHLICINQNIVNYQWSGLRPLILRRAAIYITIFGYTLFLYGLTFCYISFHSLLGNWEQRAAEGDPRALAQGDCQPRSESRSISSWSPFFPLLVYIFCK